MGVGGMIASADAQTSTKLKRFSPPQDTSTEVAMPPASASAAQSPVQGQSGGAQPSQAMSGNAGLANTQAGNVTEDKSKQ
jgi:hypothetical protein